MTEQKSNRMYKARIFEMVFSEKKELLELYNAASGNHYTDPEQLEINTLENAIYMAMRNDISFIIDSTLNLYEQQSTYNPNLPLRFLFYISDLLSDITKNKNLYGRTVIKIPTPRFLVFYNGEEERPERETLKLSDSYLIPEELASLELKATVLNINPGYNTKMKEASKTLSDYSEYTFRVRKYAKNIAIEEAVERAITECIREGILADFLSKNRAEAKKVSIYEYDQEKHMQQERESNWKEGHEAGMKEGYEAGEQSKLLMQIGKKLAKGKSISQIAEELEEEYSVIEKLVKEQQE